MKKTIGPGRFNWQAVTLLTVLTATASNAAYAQVLHFDNPPATKMAPSAAATSSATAAPAGQNPPAAKESTGTPASPASPASSTPAPGNAADPGATGGTAPVQAPASPDGAAATAGESAPVVVAPAKPKLPEDIAPPGMPAAMKLYNAGKYPLAQKQFENFINTGVADEATHLNLAYCLYYQRKYSQALKQFDWVGKNAKHSFSMQNKAQNTAAAIRSYQRGICPGSCLKPTDSRWQVIPSLGSGKWCKFSTGNGGWKAFSEAHMGDMIQTVGGVPTDMGPCPVCGGRGSVTPLVDGAPLPGQ